MGSMNENQLRSMVEVCGLTEAQEWEVRMDMARLKVRREASDAAWARAQLPKINGALIHQQFAYNAGPAEWSTQFCVVYPSGEVFLGTHDLVKGAV